MSKAQSINDNYILLVSSQIDIKPDYTLACEILEDLKAEDPQKDQEEDDDEAKKEKI